jgi:hypothetical protein
LPAVRLTPVFSTVAYAFQFFVFDTLSVPVAFLPSTSRWNCPPLPSPATRNSTL